MSRLDGQGFVPRPNPSSTPTPTQSKTNWFGSPQDRTLPHNPSEKTQKKLESNVSDLKKAGFTAKRIRILGKYPDEEIIKAGFPLPDLKAAGFNVSDLKKAGFTARQIRIFGKYPDKDILDAGFNVRQLKDAGFTAEEIRKNRKHSDKDILDAGFTVSNLQKAGFTAEEIRNNGKHSDEEIIKEKFSLPDLKKAKISAAQLRASGVFTIDQIKNALLDPLGPQSKENKLFSDHEIDAAEPNPKERMSDLIEADFNPLKFMGFIVYPKKIIMKIIKKSIKALI